MSEMVERVARAICGEPRGCDYPQCRCSPSWIVGIDRRAKAAITAMREPTEAMVERAIDRYRTALMTAREKLVLYRSARGAEYIGGMEYTALIRLIDDALCSPPT